MMEEKTLAIGEFYHIYTKSIAGFNIFNNDDEFSRMRSVIKYYLAEDPLLSFSKFIISSKPEPSKGKENNQVEGIVRIIAYCLMPTHLHLILEQLEEKGISVFMNKVLNSYTRYFNLKHGRKGPLWESRFKNVLVSSDEQLLHLTRYIHLNPVTAYLVEKPEDWEWSSYSQYLGKDGDGICCLDNVLEIESKRYQKFVEDRIGYQRELARIKAVIIEDDSTNVVYDQRNRVG
jgi:putative transposase